MNNLSLSQKKRTFGLASIILSLTGLIWFLICFTAKEAKWWNSLWIFFLIFALSISLGVFGRNSMVGKIGIAIGAIGLLVVSFLLYVG